MQDTNKIESMVQQALKKLLLIFLGTGLVGNAVYIYGLAYYEGYMKSIGLDVLLFPIDWSEARLWTYFASRELGVSTAELWFKFSGPFILIFMFLVYVIVRLWVAANTAPRKARIKSDRIKKLRKIVRLKRSFPRLYVFLKFMIMEEQAFFAFFASYFALIFMMFVPLFLLVWAFFPNVGLSHGEYVGKKRVEYYQKHLCGDNSEFWSRCVAIDTAHLAKALPSTITARIIATNGDLFGLMTEGGPVTMTKPQILYFLNTKNNCYEKDCVPSSSKDTQ